MKLKTGTPKQRKEARKWLQESLLNHQQAAEIAEYFINTLPWSRLVEAHQTLKERQ